MFSRAGAAAHAASVFPKMYVDAVIVGIIAYFAFKVLFFSIDLWRQENK